MINEITRSTAVGLRILYISYNGALEPLFQSQGMPYIIGASQRGHNFFLLTFEKFQNNINRKSPSYRKINKKFSENNIKWISLRFHASLGIIAKMLDFIQGAIISCILILKFKINAVQTRGLFAALIALAACSVTRRVFIFDIRSKLSEAYVISGRWKENSIIFRFINLLEGICVRYSKAIVVETNIHKREIENHTNKSKLNKLIGVIPCCVDLTRFQNIQILKNLDSNFVISYLGSLSGWYCFEEIINFFKKANEILSSSQLIFLTKDNPEDIFQYIKNKNILSGDSIKVYNASPEEVPKFLANSKAGIVFRYPNKRLSSFPIKVGEYLASGIPVILNSGMGDVESFILDNNVGVVVNRFSDDEFMSAFHRLLSLTKENDLKQRCLDAASILSMENGIGKYVNLYNKIIL